VAERIYIHETINISVRHRKAYLDHFTNVWGPKSRELYGMVCFGVWATVGSVGAWPEAVVMWELEDHEHLGKMLSGEFAYLRAHDAPIADHFENFWAGAVTGVVATSGFDRLLAATDESPSVADAIARGIRGEGYYHETISTRPGVVSQYLERYGTEWRAVAEEHGLVFVGAYRTLFRNDSEAIALWAIPEWSTYAELDRALRRDRRVKEFRESTADLGVDWIGKLLTAAEANPMNTGILL
jgi:hypothetical protein